MRTKTIFILKNSTSNDLELFKPFKGLVVVETRLSEELVKEIFSLNKSIVVSLENVPDDITLENSCIISIGNKISNFAVKELTIRHSELVEDFKVICKYLSLDVGDYKTKETFTHSKNTNACIFCNLDETLNADGRLCLYKTDHLTAFVTLGAFIPGYLLITPNEHITSFGGFNIEYFDELQTAIFDVKYLLEQIYHTDVVVWENGSGLTGEGKPTSSIVHAHIHLCPSCLPVLESISKDGLILDKINLSDLDSFKYEPYLLISEDLNTWHILYNVEEKIYIPRQYIRQILCNTSSWNWREFSFGNNMEQTDNDFVSYIKKHYSELSNSIQKGTKHLLD